MNIGYNRASDPAGYGAVILAAGLSSRMNAFKPLLPVDGRPALTGLVETIRSAGIRDIVLVTGYRREDLQEEIRRGELTESYNEGYEQGMFSSIQTGLAKAAKDFPDRKGWFLVPVDCPLITIRALRELMAAADKMETGSTDKDAANTGSAGCFLVPTYEGKKGHPLLIPASRIEEITSYNGPEGLKGVTDRDWDQMIRVPVPDEEILLDMDTPEGYEEIRHFVAKGFKREKLEILSSRKRVILVRHGETQQHEEPMFIGQYDVPLSEEGRAQAETLGEEIADLIADDVMASRTWIEGISLGKEPLPPIENVWCSDLQRARETAEIIADRIHRRYGADAPCTENLMNAMTGFGGSTMNPDAAPIHVTVLPLEGLREIDLGEWDGRPIREVREEDPAGYERRGKDLFAFKKGNKSENFYDMQYRAVAALREILADDDARNIVIVCHSGVIRALENNLKGLRVDDEWEPLPKGNLRVWESGKDPVRQKYAE